MPEVIQTSAMDCGPASLKSLLEGLGKPVSYGRLREACQTDVDGTSIDKLEELLVQLGVEAEQTILPIDHLLLPEAKALPAIVLVRLPSGFTHFVTVWSRHGPLAQVMDPASGRRWPTVRRLTQDLFPHTMPLPADGWREWATSDEFLGPLGTRLARLGLKARDRERLVSVALGTPGPMGLATLDAATRMTEAMASAGAVRRSSAGHVLESLLERARSSPEGPERIIPESYWCARPAPVVDGEEPQVLFRGTVAIVVRGLKSSSSEPTATPESSLSPELRAALTEPPARPGRQLWSLLRQEPLSLLWATLGGLGLGAGAVVLQALLFRSLLDLGRSFGPPLERLGALAALLLFLIALALVELPTTLMLKSIGRKLEARLRIAFFEKIPKLGDRYFRSRPSSDMAHRSHDLHLLRLLPELMGRTVRALVELAATTAGIIWLAPASALPALLACTVSVFLPLALQPLLVQWDMRVRTHTGSLSQFYLDAFQGLVAIRTHSAARSVRAEHEGLLVEWSKASTSFLLVGVLAEGLQAFFGFGLAALLVTSHITQASDASRVLLLIYWALNLPVLGNELAAAAREYPGLRNTTLRLLEPLGAREEEARSDGAAPTPPATTPGAEPEPVSVELQKVTVLAAGHVILQDVDLHVAPGSHVAVVGPSGAGKSSLVGLLLGWHQPSSGELRTDGVRLEAERLVELRRRTVWVDPATQLWNRSLLENLRYGSVPGTPPLPRVLEQAELLSVLARMPEGLQTPLGEGGGLVSGGEGQRVRLGRGMLQEQVRLVVLDEPFRGLDRERRQRLMGTVRELWKGKTLFCITHDVRETLGFQRVLVIDGGRLVEDGDPKELAAREDSRYRALLDAEELVEREIWRGEEWRRLRLERGQLVEEQRPERKTA